MIRTKIRTELIPFNAAWGGTLESTISNSFKHGYSPSRLHGPAQFLRLLYEGGMGAEGFKKKPSHALGCFWFAEADILRIKAELQADLKKQEPSNRATHLNRMGFALRNEIRQKLAICRDWSPRFDTFARLTIPPQQAVVGLIGEAKGQDVYSPDFPGHESAIAPDTNLSGGLMQYVIRFDIPANAAATNWIEPHLNFSLLCY